MTCSRSEFDSGGITSRLSVAVTRLAALRMTQPALQSVCPSAAYMITGSGHPVASAVALENLKIIEEEGLVEYAADIGQYMQTGLEKFISHPLVGEIRSKGLIAAVELVADRETKTPFETIGKLGRHLASRAQKHGMITRAMGDSIAFCPPLISTKEEIQEMLDIFGRALDETLVWSGLGSD